MELRGSWYNAVLVRHHGAR
ncbi:hypothetical protein LINPERHAP1_LOCUS31652 [Linum perenne]